MINENEFVTSRKGSWETLRFLSLKFDGSPKNITRVDISQFLELYDSVCLDLSRARSETGNAELIESLNAVIVRANRIKYRIPVKRQLVTLPEVLFHVAITVRKNVIFLWISFLVFLFSCCAGFAILQFVPDTRAMLVPKEMEPNFDRWKSGVHEERTGEESMMAWSMYSGNNSVVSLRTAAIGASTFGIGTTVSLWENGLLLGALAQETNKTGALGHLLTSIYPHGAGEIFGILVSGSAGYTMAWGVIAPGRRTRRAAIIESSKSGFTLFCLAAVMMFIAAPFEGWFSFNPNMPMELKAIVGTIVLISWISFFALYGKGRNLILPNQSNPEMKLP